jgi:hypothetical protein
LRLIFSRAINAVCGLDLNPEEVIATGCGMFQTHIFKMPARTPDVNKFSALKLAFDHCLFFESYFQIQED